MADLTDHQLLAELGVEVEAKRASAHTPHEERIIAGFEDIQRFVDEHGHLPRHGEERDIFERLYAVRLDRIRELQDCRFLLASLDRQGLLDNSPNAGFSEPADDEALLAELGIEAAAEGEDDIRLLKHVRTNAEKQAADEIANRTRCGDFDKFKPLFEQVQHELKQGMRETRPFELKSEIETGRFFIVGGQIAYVAEKGHVFSNDQGRLDARLRVVFDNGTESNMLMRSLQRSLQRSLHKDDAGRRVTDPDAGPLFESAATGDDAESGTIYVLRSKSDHPTIAANRDLIHKIGVTGGKVETRIAHAALDATYLLADVEIVATYDLFNINRAKLETLLHRFFQPARLDLEIADRFGNPVRPREWYLLPLQAIDAFVEKVRDGTISRFRYDPATANLQLGVTA
jgi:T5orf172 domain